MLGFSNLMITTTVETENPYSGLPRTNLLAPPPQLPLRFQRIRTTMNSIQSCLNNSVTWISLQSHASIAANVDTSNATANPQPKTETNVSISARTISERAMATSVPCTKQSTMSTTTINRIMVFSTPLAMKTRTRARMTMP